MLRQEAIFVQDFIDNLHEIISMYSQTDLVILMGDSNATLQGESYRKVSDVRAKYLLDVMHYHSLIPVKTAPVRTGANASFVSCCGMNL